MMMDAMDELTLSWLESKDCKDM